MKNFTLAIIAVGLIGISAVVGVVHGRLTNRWGPQPDMLDAARRLEAMPADIEGWKAVDHELDPRVAEMLQCKGYVNRVYENVKTGQKVSVVVLLGPAGPIAVHTPEVCYSSQDYSIATDRTGFKVDDRQDLWDLRLKSNRPGAAPLRVLYGWTNDGNWHANDNPRFAYGGRPLLYKIQLAGPEPVGDNDACQEFLAAFLPVLRKHLLSPGV